MQVRSIPLASNHAPTFSGHALTTLISVVPLAIPCSATTTAQRRKPATLALIESIWLVYKERIDMYTLILLSFSVGTYFFVMLPTLSPTTGEDFLFFGGMYML